MNHRLFLWARPKVFVSVWLFKPAYAILNAIGYKIWKCRLIQSAIKIPVMNFKKVEWFYEKKRGVIIHKQNVPRPIDFLSETSRLHFKEVLEFLEIINIPYQINHNLIGDLDIGSETIFSIINTDTNLPAQAGEELAFWFSF